MAKLISIRCARCGELFATDELCRSCKAFINQENDKELQKELNHIFDILIEDLSLIEKSKEKKKNEVNIQTIEDESLGGTVTIEGKVIGFHWDLVRGTLTSCPKSFSKNILKKILTRHILQKL